MLTNGSEPGNTTLHHMLSNNCEHNVASSISTITIDVLLSILGTLGNLLVLMVILLNIRLATASNLLLANLAGIDFICMVFVAPGGIYKDLCNKFGFCHANETFVLVHRALVQFVVSAAVSSLFAIAVDRFLAISFPFKYSSLMTKRRTVYCICLTWLAGVLISAIFMGLNFVYLQSAYCTLLILVTISMYIHIFLFALKKERQIAALQVSNVKGSTNFLHERKSTKTMAIILSVFAAAWIPAVVFYIVVKPTDPKYLDIQGWVSTFYYLNASLNPFIYCVRSVNFRKRIKLLVKTSMIRFNL
ncbi:hypothetical protein ACROYT_G000266 [Oculina patagonica]